MTRAHGKRVTRGPGPASSAPDLPDEVRARGGTFAKQIPGGRQHLVNPVTPPPTAPNAGPERPLFRGIMAHGVPPEGQHYDRPSGVHGPGVREHKPPPIAPVPVPVVIVQGGGARPVKHVFTDSITAPPAGTPEPARLCSIDPNRSFVRLLNEQPAGVAGTRVGSLSDLASGKGALLPPAMSGYLTLETHDELFAISADATADKISVILETETPGA